MRDRGWLRPRRRVCPPKPKQGVHAEKPNQIWHIDSTVIQLLDGSRTYLHAIIDNFSRRILARELAARLEPQTTCQLLTEAARNLSAEAGSATVVADSGLENVNGLDRSCALPKISAEAVTRTGSAGVCYGMRIYASLMLLIAFAVVLPGGLVLLPLAYAKYRKISGRT